MTQGAELGPDSVVAIGDPGDETARRYRYQWTYAGICCCSLLDETQDVQEVFCEHHEDVLLKHADGTFSGLQIKTRDSSQDVWKTGDQPLRAAFVRFAKLEAQFPGQFRSYRFLTNHPLFAGGNSKDICYVLAQIKRAATRLDLPGPVLAVLSKIAKAAGCPDDVAFAALAKSQASDALPKLHDAETRLVTTLTPCWDAAENSSVASVQKAARALVAECGRASSLAHEDVLPAYLPLMAGTAEVVARVKGKCIDRARVLGILNDGLNSTAILDGGPQSYIQPGVGTKDLLLAKLEAGGFSAVSQTSAGDLRDKADYLGIVWMNKHGSQKGLQRYNHVRSVVLADAARAFESTKTTERTFGVPMLSDMRARIKERRSDGNQLYDCSDEHLEGFAYSLTSECTVTWSLDRPWEKPK